MTTSPTYWLDTNVLIDAKNGPYRFEVMPAFWSVLEMQISSGRIRIPKMVYDEIVRDESKDKLAQWMKLRKANGFCSSPSKSVQETYRQIADHVYTRYEAPFAAEFLSVADPWVIAHAMESKGVVVTFEKQNMGAKRVKIPNVCAELNIPRMNLYDMLQALGVEFK